MKEIIEIYSKIVVATFGFIGPSFTLLISIFIDAIEKARIKNDQQLETIKSLYDDAYVKNKDNIEEEMTKIIKENKKHKKQIIKESNLLNPKRQIKRVFIPLILSLFFISLYYFARTNYCLLDLPFIIVLKCVAIIISGICFSYCLFALWQILNMVIEAKQILIKDKNDKVVKQEKEEEIGEALPPENKI
ncbi:hypothetical protein [Flavobacterium sp. Root186]|uniref:hypothetical protein n=1 Tax=Flavobacterium sp. Root186 TaxID=1736485 RepID=UPI0006F5891F|nr:hypothetical protein [Flavobacterium sp. Root186]KRB55908.1 hypothetical protein ASD98_14780 [Flavobacterium sp. Root186]